jgi:hypothetical protein
MLQRNPPPLGTAVAKLSRQRIFERPGLGISGHCARAAKPRGAEGARILCSRAEFACALSTNETHEKDRTNDPEGIL